MDSLFEKELLKIQLLGLFDTYDDKKAREIIIKCIDTSIFKSPVKSSKKKVDYEPSSICNMCQSTEFVMTNSEELCKSCGSIHRTLFNSNSYKPKTDSQFIPMGENKLKTTIEGKEVTLDIDKFNLYAMSSLTPQQKIYKQGTTSIQKILDEFTISYTNDELKSIFIMYWNITLYYEKNKYVRPSFKPTDNKRAYQCLCVYYNLQREINIYKLIEAFDVTLTNLEYFNKLLPVIFKDTNYSFNSSIKEENILTVSDEKITQEANSLLEKLIEARLFKSKSKETFGATVIYVARDILKISYTFSRVQDELDIINAGKLSQMYKQIVNFVKMNPKILK